MQAGRNAKFFMGFLASCYRLQVLSLEEINIPSTMRWKQWTSSYLCRFFSNRMIRNTALLLIWLGLLCAGCSRNAAPVASPAQEPKPASVAQSGPACIVYKTKADYSRNVPVILSADKSVIVSFPDVSDLGRSGAYLYPEPLDDGFWLDNRGINGDVAFLDYTYESYTALKQTPSAGDLFQHLLDKDPLTEMERCGNRQQYNDVRGAMNEKIKNGFQGCKKLK